MFQIKKKT